MIGSLVYRRCGYDRRSSSYGSKYCGLYGRQSDTGAAGAEQEEGIFSFHATIAMGKVFPSVVRQRGNHG